jgi:hypothetical protein
MNILGDSVWKHLKMIMPSIIGYGASGSSSELCGLVEKLV